VADYRDICKDVKLDSTKLVELLTSQGDCTLGLYLYVTVNIFPVSLCTRHTQSVVISIGLTRQGGGVRGGGVV
jgi:hypothetical protein